MFAAAFLDRLALGGPVVWILLCFSLAALTVTLIKLWQFWQFRPLSRASARQALIHLEKGERSQALMLVKGQRNPRSHLIAYTLALLDKRTLDLDEIKAEARRLARTLINRLNSYLRVLEVIATLAPLLGLFGTVLGMIEAFRAMEAAGSQVNPAVLSGGIWKALLTTAVGLAVAIPVSLAHSWFERRVEVQATDMQDDLERIFTLDAEAASTHARPSAKQA